MTLANSNLQYLAAATLPLAESMADGSTPTCEAINLASRERSRSPRGGHASASEMPQPDSLKTVLATAAGRYDNRMNRMTTVKVSQQDELTLPPADDMPEDEYPGPEDYYDGYNPSPDGYERNEEYTAEQEFAEAQPFSWRTECVAQPNGKTRTMVARKAASGALICELFGLGPNTCGLDLHGVIAQADGIHPTEKRIIMDTTEIAVYDSLLQFESSTEELTVVYEPLVSRLGSSDPATRVKAVWAAAKASDQNIESVMADQATQVCEALVNSLKTSGTREVSGALRAIDRIIEVGVSKIEYDDDGRYNPFVVSMETAGATEALNALLRENNPALCDVAWELLHDHFGEPSYAGGMTPDAITD